MVETQTPPILPLRALNHISRVCKDVAASTAFYRDVLGFCEIKRPESFDFEGSWLFNYGIGIHLIAGIPPVRSSQINPKADHLSFQADSLESVETALCSSGFQYIRQIIEEAGVRVTQLFFHDPDNNMIEICNCDLLPVIPLSQQEEEVAAMCPTCALHKERSSTSHVVGLADSVGHQDTSSRSSAASSDCSMGLLQDGSSCDTASDDDDDSDDERDDARLTPCLLLRGVSQQLPDDHFMSCTTPHTGLRRSTSLSLLACTPAAAAATNSRNPSMPGFAWKSQMLPSASLADL